MQRGSLALVLTHEARFASTCASVGLPICKGLVVIFLFYPTRRNHFSLPENLCVGSEYHGRYKQMVRYLGLRLCMCNLLGHGEADETEEVVGLGGDQGY